MVADCGATCAKYVLCLFNFAFFVSKDKEIERERRKGLFKV